MQLSNEHRFIRECLALNPSPAFGATLQPLITPTLDWQKIIDAAAWHGVAPLMYRNLKSVDSGGHVPADFLAGLKRLYHDNLMRNMVLEALLGRVLTQFRARQVDCIVLKGMALAKLAYGDTALRPMGDIDLLVRRDDLTRAESALIDMGFELDGAVERDWALQHHYELAYGVPGQDVLIDLHWHISHHRLATRVQIADDTLINAWWTRTRPFVVADQEARTLGPADTLFHLCQHFLKSRFAMSRLGFVSTGGLIQLCDIANVARGEQNHLDWSQLKHDTAAYRMDSLTGAVMALAMTTVPGGISEIPLDAQPMFEPSTEDQNMVNLIGECLFNRDDAASPLTRAGFGAMGGESVRERMTNLVSIIFPAKAWLAQRFGVAPGADKIYWYYLVYPFIWLGKRKRLRRHLIRIKNEAALKRWIGDPD